MTALRSDPAAAPATPPPHLALLQMIRGALATQLVGIAAMLGIPDLLKAGPRSSADIAAELGLHARSLHRMMRGLVLFHVFFEDEEGRFGLTPIGELLRSDVPGSLADFAIGMLKVMAPAMQGLPHTVRTGEIAFDHVFGVKLFDYYAKNRDIGERFDRFMTSVTEAVAAAVTQLHDFSSTRKLCDVGGGNGVILASIVAANPGTEGLLYDMPPVAAGAEQRFKAARIEDRCKAAGGDFFESVPSGHDTYLLSWILHDWDDQDCIRILRNCHAAMGGEGTLLVFEQLLPDRVEQNPLAVIGDLDLLAMLPGRERSLQEYTQILATAGFTVVRVSPVQSPMGVVRSIIEARPA